MAWNIRCSAIIPSRSCELHAATTLRIRIEFLEQADAAVTIREHILKGCCLFHFRKVMPVKVKQIEGVEDGIGGGLARAPPAGAQRLLVLPEVGVSLSLTGCGPRQGRESDCEVLID